MLCVQQRPPVDYAKCNQTITVYHQVSVGEYTCTVYTNAFLDCKKTQNVDKTGSREANAFLLVIPCSEQAVFVGDKVLLGVGKELTSAKEWGAFIPVKVPGLVVVKYVDPKYWKGRLVHVEAGG